MVLKKKKRLTPAKAKRKAINDAEWAEAKRIREVLLAAGHSLGGSRYRFESDAPVTGIFGNKGS